MNTPKNVGFIGLGLMGQPMAKNILKKGFSLGVYNRTNIKTEELQKLGAKVYDTPADLAREADIIITMVTASGDVDHILFDEEGVVKTAKKGSVVIDMSTIGPTAAKQIANKLEKYEIDFIDAPVTGSTPKAITGELTIFIGGKKELFEKLRPLFATMGTNIHYIGNVGAGQSIKLINNHLIAVSITALAEGFILADTLGLSREKVGEVLRTVPAMSGFMNLKLPNYVSNIYPLLFSAKNMTKDLSLAVKEAQKNKQKLSLLETTLQLYEKAVEKKLSEEDMSTVIKVMR